MCNMKRKLIAIILCALMLLSLVPSAIAETRGASERYLEINKNNFPDLYSWIIEHYHPHGDAQSGYYMTERDVQNVKVIYLDRVNDSISMKGLELLPYIEEIYVENAILSDFSIDRLKHLKRIDFSNVKSSVVDYSGCIDLESFVWFNGAYELFDILYMDSGDESGNNVIESLDFTGCVNLKQIKASARRVNVKNCSKLESLKLYAYSGMFDERRNPITGVADNLSGCHALKELWTQTDDRIDFADFPQLEVLALGARDPYRGTIALDLHAVPDLKVLLIGNTYALEQYRDGRYITDTEFMYNYNEREGLVNEITSLDLSHNTALEYLAVSCPMLTELDLSNNASLRFLQCFNTKFDQLDLTGNTGLKRLDVMASEIDLDLRRNTELEIIYCERSAIDRLDLSGNTGQPYVCCSRCTISELNASQCANLQELNCTGGSLTTLNLAGCTGLKKLYCSGFMDLVELDLSQSPMLNELYCEECGLTELDLSENPELRVLDCSDCNLGRLDLSHNPKLEELSCLRCELYELDLSHNPELVRANLRGNHLSVLDTSGNPKLDDDNLLGFDQTLFFEQGMERNGDTYTFDLAKTVGAAPDELTDVEECCYKLGENTWISNAVSYNPETGIVTADHELASIYYSRGPLGIEAVIPYTGNVRIVWTDQDGSVHGEALDAAEFKGTTPYVVYQGRRAYEPQYCIATDDDLILSELRFTYAFSSNTTPGTGRLAVTMNGSGRKLSSWFKIYLPATGKTDVANTKTGITVTWKKVDSAKGYVIYRRAWNLVDNGWTMFERWNNTTATSWTDTKVFAGTRYQYGVKAYYSDPMDNYNLGLLGPLKTTTRITTRTLKSAAAGTKSLTAKWDGSKTVTGYQVKIATDAGFTKNVKAVKVTRPDIYQTTLKGLKSNTTYYVTVRGYQVFNGMTYFGEWSNVKSCRVK